MIVLDTHVLLWWVSDPEKLSKKAQQRINQEQKDGTILISSISIWEIAMLVSKKKLALAMDTNRWIETIEALPFVTFVPVDNTIAIKSVTLPGELHANPADRIIIATAREKGIPLITCDEKIRNYSHVESVW